MQWERGRAAGRRVRRRGRPGAWRGREPGAAGSRRVRTPGCRAGRAPCAHARSACWSGWPRSQRPGTPGRPRGLNACSNGRCACLCHGKLFRPSCITTGARLCERARFCLRANAAHGLSWLRGQRVIIFGLGCGTSGRHALCGPILGMGRLDHMPCAGHGAEPGGVPSAGTLARRA